VGQISDDITSGLCCSLCGIYFRAEAGFPVLCTACWKDNPEERDGYQRATAKEA
jgi:hypothetical protein